MPTLESTSRGTVVSIWGKAYIRGTDGVWRPLKLGEVVKQGDHIITEQNSIVELHDGRAERAPIAAVEAERAITELETGTREAAPAAGLSGGDSGDLQPGLRVDRIVENVSPASLVTQLDALPVAGVANDAATAPEADTPANVAAGSSSVVAIEEGVQVNLGLTPPTGGGNIVVIVTQVPVIGQISRADGTPVAAGATLASSDLPGLRYVPPVDYDGVAPVGSFGYTASNGTSSANGGTQISVTPVNDAPVATAGSASGAEDGSLGVSLGGTDVDGTVASVAVTTLPANGTLFLAGGVTPVLANQALTPAQASGLVFRPNADFNGNANIVFTVTDSSGAVSSPANFALTVTPVNDAPMALDDSVSTVGAAPVTTAVLANDRDVDGDAIRVTGATVNAAQGAAVVNADGTITFTAAPGTSGPVVINYTIADASGATASATLTVNVAGAPAVTVDGPALTNDSTPTITGTSNLPPGASVTLTVTGANGAVQVFSAVVQPDGTYSAPVPNPLAEGAYSVSATASIGGNTATANDGGTIDTTAPTITVDAPALGNDSTPTITGTTNLPPGSTVTLTVTGANGAVQTFTATVQPGGTYSADVPAPLAEGSYTVVALGTDPAGNTGSANDAGLVDTTPPTISVDAPALVNDTTPTIVGTTNLPVGATVSLTVTGANGAVQTFTATVQPGGTYSADVPTPLVEGSYSVVASAADAAGNPATANDTGVVDTTPPTLTVDAPALGNDTTPTIVGTTNLPAGATITLTVTSANGAAQTFTTTVQAGGTYSADVPAALAEGGYSVVARATDAAGNAATANDSGVVDATPPAITVEAPALTNDNTPTITGTTDLPPGSTVTLTVTGADGAVQNFTATVQAGGAYSADVPAALVQGNFSVVARGTDAAGNTASANDSGAIDTTPPVITVDAPAITNDTTPAITGTTDLPAGATITLTVTGANGAVQTFTTTVQAGGTYTAAVPAALAEGTYGVVASGTDAAGNSASASDSGVLDVTPPTVTVDAPTLTNDSTPTIVGATNLASGSTVTLTVTGANGATQTFTATVQAGGTYSVDVPAALVQGTFSVTATATDPAGNSASAADSGVIDTTAPTITVDVPALTNDTTPTITGTTDLPPGASVSLTVTGANGASQTFSATVQAGGTYSVDVPAALVEGNFNVVATATDAAGNSANANDSGTIDTTPPAATLTIDPVTADNIVNVGETTGTVAITGTVGGDVRVGDTVTITVNGSAYVGLVLAGNTFSIAVPGAGVLADADRRIDGSVTTADAAGNSATATVTRDYAVNTAPVAVADSASVGEDAINLIGDATPGTLGQDSDADGDALTVVGVAEGVQASASGNVGTGITGTWGTLTLAADGSYTYVPAAAAQSLDAGETVTDTFTYTISDGRGGSATATIAVSVVGADDPTTIAGTLAGTVREDVVATATGVLSATDPDVGSRSFAVQPGTAGTYGTFAIDAAGNWTYTLANAAANVQALAQGQSVTETFMVTADDGTTASVTVTVNGSNDAPVVASTSINAAEEGASVALGLAVPTDIDNGATLTITVTGLPTIGQVQLADGTPVANGATLSSAQLGGLRYLPPTDYDGVAAVGSFGYSVSDGITSVSGGTAIALAAINDPPVASNASAGTGENAVLNASVPAATDVDGTVASYQLVGGVGAGNGTLAFNPDGSYVFNPGSDFDTLAAGATRQVTFTYTATDNNGAPSNTATVTITVTGTNDAPIATVTPATGDEDTPIAVSLTGSDIDGTIASVTVTALPANGTLFLADGVTPVAAGTPLTPAQAASLVFAPAPDFNGTVNVTFTVTDNNGAVSAPATTPIVVQPVVDPTISINDVTVNEAAGTITFTVSLDQPTTATVRVGYATTDGTATAGSDYTGGSGTLTFAPGVTTQTITLPILNDGTYEGAENFTVTLSSPVNGTIADGSGVGTIRDDGTGAGGTDNDTPVLAVSNASATEGGFAVFTVSLSNPSTTAVTFNPTLTSGSATVGTDTASALEFFDGSVWQPVAAAGVTLAAGATSVQVRVATADDAYLEGSESFTLTAAVSSGATTAPSAAGTGTISDDVDVTTVSLTAPANVAEGGSITYTATLTNAAQSPVTVTLSNGATIVIAAGATSGTATVAAPGDDVYVDAASVSATITDASGGNFESLAVDPAPATTTISDTVDTTVVSLSATNAVAEGGTIVYTATLTNAAQTPVTVTLSTGETITIAAGATVGTVNIAAPGDDPYIDAGSVSRTISAASGGSFESLVVNPAAAVTVIADTTDTTVLSLSATPTVAEGGTITYTATLTNAAQAPVTVTLSTGETITIAAGATAGSVNIAAPTDDAFIDAGIVSRTIAGAIGGNFESRVINPNPATTTVTDTVDVTTVSLAATPSVAEGGSIVYTATLTNAADTPVTVSLSNGATITIAAGATTGTVSVAAPSDDPYLDAGSVSATISSAAGGNFESLVVNATPAVTTVTDTVNVTTVGLSATPSVAEGGSIVYTATLTNAADTPVTVTLSTGETITIAAGATTGTVSIAAPSDDPYIDAGSVSRTISTATGGNFESLVVNAAPAVTTVTDTIDVTTATLTATPIVVEGGTITYTVSLAAPVTGSPVTMNLANGEVITIGIGASSGTVTAVAPDNVFAGGGSVTNSIASATGGNFENLAPNTAPVTTSITDTIDVTTISLSATASVAEGGSIVYTATLTNAADTPVTVTLSTGETVTIAAGATSGTVSIAAPTDDPYLDAGSVSRTISTATGGNFESLVVNAAPAVTTVTDTIDVTTATLTATASVVEGGTITYTVSLAAPVTGSPVTVNLTNGQVITIGIGSSTGTATATASDNAYSGGGSVTNSIASISGGNFESLAPNTAAVTTTVIDDVDVTTVSLSATATVAEGGSIVYTATLTNAAQTAVAVTLSTGQVINIAAGTTTGTVSIAAPNDDPYIDAGSVSRTIASASGGNFESLVVNTTSAVTAVTDTIDVTTATLTATPSVVEGGTITYTVSLAAAVTGSPVTVNLTNGQVITIPVGASSGTATAVAPDNVYSGGGSVTNSIASVSGGNFESLAPNIAPVTTAVTDDVDVTTATLTATPSVVEGGTITYTATLTNAAQTPVTLTLSNGATITIGAGATSGTTTVAAPADDPYVDAGTVSATISTATGGNFESLQINPAAATTSVTDDVDVTTISLSTTATVAEGGSIVYTATLTNAADTAVTVTLSTGETITIAAGATTGTVSISAPGDDPYIDATTVSRTIASASGGNFESLVVDTTAALTTVTDTIDVTTTTLTATPSVVEGGTITYTVSLAAAVTGSPVSVLLANGQTVTIPVAASSSSVTAIAPDDVYGGGASVGNAIVSVSGGNFERLVANTSPVTTSVTDDNDPTTVSLAATASVTEGGSISYIATLTNAAQTPVTVTLSNGATITIGAGATTGTVTVAAPADDPYVDAGTVSATIVAATGGNFELLAVNPAPATTTVSDTVDVTTIGLGATASVAEGGSIVYTATLTNSAQTPVTVTLSTGQTITIAAGATTGTVSIAAPTDDPYLDAGTVSRTIASASGGNFESLQINSTAATTTVTDTVDTTTLSITGSASVTEGASGSYAVSLTSPAQTAVTVNLTYSGTAANGADYTGVATVTIAAGASSATFNIATIDDNIDEVAAESFTVAVASASGGNFENLVVSGTNNSVTTAIVDNDPAPTISVSNPTVGEAGGFAQFTIGLSGPSSQNVTVSLALANGTATGGGVDYGAALEVSTDGGANWVSASSVTLLAGTTSVLARTPIVNDALDEANETFTLTATRTAGTTSNASAFGTATITDNDPTPTLSIGNVTVNEAAGTATFTVTLSAASGQAVSVNYATANNTAVAPGDYLAASGTLNFAPGQTSQTITVTINDDATTEASETFNVNLSAAANATILVGTGVGTILDNDTPPLGRDATVTTLEDTGVAFSLANFLMDDAEQGLNQNPSAVRIDTLPVNGTLTLSGAAVTAGQVITAAQVTNLVFTPAANANGGSYANFNFSVRDASGQFDTVPNTITVNVTAVNDAPVNTVPASITVTEDVASAITGISINDVDAGSSALSVTLSVAAGTLSATSGGGVTVTGSGTGSLALAGTQAAINGFIAGSAVTYTTAANASGSVVLTINTNDLGNAGSGGALSDVDTVTLNITAVNDAPVNTTPGAQTTAEDTGKVITGLQIADVDAGLGAMTTTLAVTNGTLTVVGGSAAISGSGTGTVTLTGTLAQINSTLSAANSVTYAPTPNFSGNATLTVTTNDGGNTGSGGALTDVDTVGIAVNAVADLPTLVAPSQIYAIVAGVNTINTSAAITANNLTGAVGLPTGALGTFDPAPGPGTSDPGNVTPFNGAISNFNYNVAAGTAVSFKWAFTNGENVVSEINNGFNDLVVVTVTAPDGTQTNQLITASETLGASVNGAGTYSFTAPTSGSYQFSWFVINGADGNKNSSLAINDVSLTSGGSVVGAIVDVPLFAQLADTDGSEALTVRVSGVPSGSSFSNGTDLGGGIWAFTAPQLNGLKFLAADGFAGTVNLSVTATATEASNGSTTTTPAQTVSIIISETTNTVAGTVSAETQTGTAANDHIQGLAGNDTINAGAGNDLVHGGAGNDVINGGDGNDILYGNAGTDTIDGGNGNDVLIGGKGNDALTGGAGSDVFRWELGDAGTAGSPAADTIADFDNGAAGDKLDLRDVLIGESTGTLTNYLHFSTSGGNTVISVSTTGAFASGFSAGAVDQTITLNSVNLIGSFTTDQQIIQDLLNRGKLIADPGPGP